MKSTRELVAERNQLISDNRKLLDANGGNLNAEQGAEYDKRDKDIDRLSDEIQARHVNDQRRERLAKYDQILAQVTDRQTDPTDPGRQDNAGKLGTLKLGKAILSEEDLKELDPQLSAALAERASEKYAKSFRKYLRFGKAGAESLGLQTGNNPQGGYLTSMGFLARFIKFLDDATPIRGLATVLPATAEKSVGALSYDTDYNDADWTAEVPASDLSEDDAARFGRRELMPHLLTKLIKTSRKMLRSSSLGLEDFIAQRLAYKFSISENKAYLTGNGNQRPLGLFVASDSGIPTSRDKVCASTSAFTADEVIDLMGNVKDQYRARGTLLCHRDFRTRARKLKDANNQYLLTMHNNDGIAVETIFGRPVVTDENAPNTYSASQYIAVFGDFSFYWIQDGIDLEIQRLDELFSLRNQVGWVARKETDAMPVLAEAFSRLQLAAA